MLEDNVDKLSAKFSVRRDILSFFGDRFLYRFLYRFDIWVLRVKRNGSHPAKKFLQVNRIGGYATVQQEPVTCHALSRSSRAPLADDRRTDVDRRVPTTAAHQPNQINIVLPASRYALSPAVLPSPPFSSLSFPSFTPATFALISPTPVTSSHQHSLFTSIF